MTIELQGITVEDKLKFYREQLSEKLGVDRPDLSAQGITITAMVDRKHAAGLMQFTERLFEAQRDAVADELFDDIVDMETAIRRLSLIHSLLIELADGENFAGKQAVRDALADLSIEIKKLRF